MQRLGKIDLAVVQLIKIRHPLHIIRAGGKRKVKIAGIEDVLRRFYVLHGLPKPIMQARTCSGPWKTAEAFRASKYDCRTERSYSSSL